MKNFYLVTFLSLSLFAILNANPISDDCDICEDDYVFECISEWVHYELNDSPAIEGLYVGNYNGEPIFVGRTIRNGFVASARIQITNPRGAYSIYGGSELFTSDSTSMWFYKKNKENLYKWENSSNGQIVPYAVEVNDGEANDGFVKYISKIDLGGGFTTIGLTTPSSGFNSYIDLIGNLRRENEYSVLTCRSKVYRPQPSLPYPSVPAPNPERDCIHEWKTFTGDDAPAFDGLSAGFYSYHKEAFVGRAFNGFFTKPGWIQLNNVGVFMTAQAENLLATVNASYLVKNPNYNYEWVDAAIGEVVPNAISFANGFPYIGRTQVNGQIQIGSVSPMTGLDHPGEDGLKHHKSHFQVLVCEPEPECPCELNWILYKNDHVPVTDGISIGYSSGNKIAYIGRAIQKLPEGQSIVVGRVDINDGVYYVNDASGREKLEADEGEYLQRNENSTYEWISSHTDQFVRNAIKIPIRCENFTDCNAECGNDGRTGYIGKATIDGVNYVGTVYKNEGLVIANSDGDKITLSSFEVLTCVAPGRCQKKERSCGNAECGWEED